MYTSSRLYLLILIFSATCINLSAQKQPVKLDQKELLKQFAGRWECEYLPDTFLIVENSPFGASMVSNSQVTANGNVLETIIQLYGYNEEEDCFNIAELTRSTAILEIVKARFLTENSGISEVLKTANAQLEWRFEFIDPDTIVQQALLDSEVINEVMLKRIKEL